MCLDFLRTETNLEASFPLSSSTFGEQIISRPRVYTPDSSKVQCCCRLPWLPWRCRWVEVIDPPRGTSQPFETLSRPSQRLVPRGPNEEPARSKRKNKTTTTTRRTTTQLLRNKCSKTNSIASPTNKQFSTFTKPPLPSKKDCSTQKTHIFSSHNGSWP